MNASAEQILEEAMRLDPRTRALVAEALLETLDVGPDFQVSEAWRAEIRRRCAEIDTGAIALIPGEQALAQLRAKYEQ
ncbi:MAG: addiction module protein [Chromatiaceae bacterium]|jgi:putative addiction module component (TIGR02574 family)